MNTNQTVLTVPQLLDIAVEKHPTCEAIYDQNRRMTYQELQADSDTLASALHIRGIQKGDRIGVCLPNWHEIVVIYFAAAKLGAVIVPFNPKYRLNEIQHIIQDSNPKCIFICPEVEQNVGLQTFVPWIYDVITVRFEKEGTTPYLELLEKGRQLEKTMVKLDPRYDDFCIIYTSGTTGLPKGAISTHENATQGSRIVAQGLKCTADDVYLITVPLTHVLGLGSCLISAISKQSKIVLLDKYSPKTAFALIETEKVTVRHAVPTMFIIEINHPDFDQYDFSSLRVGLVGGAPIHRETLNQVKEKMGMEICGGYGLTEVFSICSTMLPDSDQNILDTIGKVMPGAKAKIVNDNREELPFGEVGEIVVKGYGLFKGYLNNPEKTREVSDEEGWFYTGDLGTIDGEGYIRFKGRKKELIIRGGYNIYPKEVEEILHVNEKIYEAAVIGLPDLVLGEAVCAVIKLKDGYTASEEEIKDFLSDKIADYKVPTEIRFVDSFPVTSSGKIQKVMLRNEMINQANV